MRRNFRYFPLIAGGIFLLTAALIIGNAFLSGTGEFGFRTLFSEYIGRSSIISVLYAAVTAVMTVLLGISLRKKEMNSIRRFLYVLILLFFLITGFCPLSSGGTGPHTVFSTTGWIHVLAEIIFLGLAAVNSLLAVFFAKSKAQRIVGLLPVIYLVIILIAPEIFKENVGIWEIIFTMQPILNLQAEQYSEPADKKQPAAAS